MKTIEERAYLVYNEYTEFGVQKRNGYIKGATEQHEIDIRRAVEWHCNRCKYGKTCVIRYSQDICSKIKELTQAMKGE